MSDESWVPVPGYGGWYDVSDAGRVRSWRKTGTSTSRRDVAKVLKQRVNQQGYLEVCLYDSASGPRYFRVNRLVLRSFWPSGPAGYHAAHKNGNRTDNRLDNLEWKDSANNLQDRKAHGTMPKRLTKLSDDTVRSVRAAYDMGQHNKSELARIFYITQQASRIVRGLTYREVI